MCGDGTLEGGRRSHGAHQGGVPCVRPARGDAAVERHEQPRRFGLFKALRLPRRCASRSLEQPFTPQQLHG
jgi:hypothetical protein